MWDQQEKKEEELDSPDRISLKKKRETSFRTQRKEERGHDDDPIFVFALPRWCAPSSRSYIPEKAKESLYYFGDGLTDGRSGWERLDLGKPLLAKCGKLGKWPKLPLLRSVWTIGGLRIPRGMKASLSSWEKEGKSSLINSKLSQVASNSGRPFHWIFQFPFPCLVVVAISSQVTSEGLPLKGRRKARWLKCEGCSATEGFFQLGKMRNWVDGWGSGQSKAVGHLPDSFYNLVRPEKLGREFFTMPSRNCAFPIGTQFQIDRFPNFIFNFSGRSAYYTASSVLFPYAFSNSLSLSLLAVTELDHLRL